MTFADNVVLIDNNKNMFEGKLKRYKEIDRK